MKNNTYYTKFFLILLSFIFLANDTFAKEINIKAKEVLTFEKGNIIIGKEEVEAKINNEIEIYADKITYNKEVFVEFCNHCFDCYVENERMG